MPSANFRAGVVAAVTDSRGRLLVFERSDIPGAWQLAQGGIDVGESPQEAAWRELGEETGLGAEEVDLVGEHRDWIVYEFPDGARDAGKRLGQAQRWFHFRVRDDSVVPTPDDIEFTDWQWVEPAWLIEHVVEFRRTAYRTALSQLRAP